MIGLLAFVYFPSRSGCRRFCTALYLRSPHVHAEQMALLLSGCRLVFTSRTHRRSAPRGDGVSRRPCSKCIQPTFGRNSTSLVFLSDDSTSFVYFFDAVTASTALLVRPGCCLVVYFVTRSQTLGMEIRCGLADQCEARINPDQNSLRSRAFWSRATGSKCN